MDKEIITRYFAGKVTTKEEQELLNWINRDRKNFEYYLQERKLWDALIVNGYREESEQVVTGNFNDLRAQINIESGQESESLEYKMPGLYRLLPWLRYAAVFILGLLTYVAYLNIVHIPDQQAWNELVIPKGNRVHIELPDKSVVWLNSQTKFRYPEKFTSRKREVWLNGEAFFEVHKDPESRFIVHTSKLSVEALGTSFNVLAYDNENTFETALVTGKIRILNEDAPNSVHILKPKELAVYNKEGKLLNIHNVDVDLYTCWKNGEFRFKNERLEVIAHKLERYYNLRIEFGDNDIRDYRLTGTFPVSESWEKILTVIVRSTGTRYSISENVAILEKAGS